MKTAEGTVACGFAPFSDDVYGWAYRILGRHQDALDVVQDVFLRWHEQCQRERPANERGWLRRVTMNRAIDVRRGWSVTRRAQQSAARTEWAFEEARGEAEADEDSLRRDVAEALSDLTEMQRSVLVAKVYDEMTFAEIANEWGAAVSTVKTHFVRALQSVRLRLHPRWSQEIIR